MMAVMGYFRSPRLHLHGRSKAAAAERGEELRGGESLSAALLDAAGGEPAVPRGHFAVYVGAGARRFVVPTSCLRDQAFRGLMERAAEEFGFAQAGGLRIPCGEEDFEATVSALHRRRQRRRRPGRAGAAALAKAMSL
ncbi:hypothetical protein ACP4OV_009679 [Aristida adscensionis]